MNIKKGLKYGLVISVIVAILFFIFSYSYDHKPLLDALLTSVFSLVFFILLYTIILLFLYFLSKFLFKILDLENEKFNIIKEKQISNNDDSKKIFPKSSFWGLLITIIYIFGVLLILFYLQYYLFLPILNKYNFLNHNQIYSFTKTILGNSLHSDSYPSNYEIIISILSIVEFKYFFYKWLDRIW